MMRNRFFPARRLSAAVTVVFAAACAAAAQTANSVSADQARTAIVKAQEAQSAAGAYSVRFSTVDLADGGTSSGVLKFVAPDRYHFISDQGGEEGMHIGNQGFLKKAQSKAWKPEPFELTRVLETYRGPARVGAEGVRTEGFAYVGRTRLGKEGFEVYRYQATRLGERSKITVWIAGSDGLPRQYQDEMDLGFSRARRTWVITYDPSLRIQAPKVR
jgi:outer membrane lipoprotein-sorting protein